MREQVASVSAFDWVIFIWSVPSAIAAILSQFVLVTWLRNKGCLKWFDPFAGMPGYVDNIYISWCVANNRPYKRVIIIRKILLFNGLFASIGIFLISSSLSAVGR